MSFPHRRAVAFGALAAAMVFVPLAALAVLVAGMSECSSCSASGFVLNAWMLAAALALIFGAVIGPAAALLKHPLEKHVTGRAAAMILVLAIAALAYPTISFAPSLYNYVTYLRTPRDQLPPNDPRRRPSNCSPAKLPRDTVCAY